MEQKEVVKAFEDLWEVKFDNVQSLEGLLSIMFQRELTRQDDPQGAFNVLNTEMGGLLEKHFNYTLSGGNTWKVSYGDKYQKLLEEYYLESAGKRFNEEYVDIDDLFSELESRVEYVMSNVGCDCITALSKICEDDLGLEGIFKIVDAQLEPRIILAS